MHSYEAYGLRIGSEITFPNLVAGQSDDFEVVVRFGDTGQHPSQADVIVAGENYCATNTGIYLFWDGWGTLFVREGCEIIVDVEADVDVNVLRSTILSQGFDKLLEQRGQLVLHASAVAIDHCATAFVAAPGRGKSTYALALCMRGHLLIADDLTALRGNEYSLMAIPAYPQVSVSSETLTALSYDFPVSERVEHRQEKHAVLMKDRFVDRPLSLTNIFVLEDGTVTFIEPLEPRKAIIELLRHSNHYWPLTKEAAAAHLHQCALLANTASVARLTVRRSFSELNTVVGIVENQVERNAIGLSHSAHG